MTMFSPLPDFTKPGLPSRKELGNLVRTVKSNENLVAGPGIQIKKTPTGRVVSADPIAKQVRQIVEAGTRTHLAVVVEGDPPDDDGSQFVTVRAVEKIAPTDEGGAITWKFAGDPQPVLCLPGETASYFKLFKWPGAQVDSVRTHFVRVTLMGGDWYAERIWRDVAVPPTELAVSDCRMPEEV